MNSTVCCQQSCQTRLVAPCQFDFQSLAHTGPRVSTNIESQSSEKCTHNLKHTQIPSNDRKPGWRFTLPDSMGPSQQPEKATTKRRIGIFFFFIFFFFIMGSSLKILDQKSPHPLFQPPPFYFCAVYSAVLVSGVLGHLAIAQWTSDAMLGISRTATTVRAGRKRCEGVSKWFFFLTNRFLLVLG